MENNQDSQLNRGRCVYPSKSFIATDNEQEINPDNLSIEKGQQNILIHDSEGQNKNAAKKEGTS
jgi:hypothetical protein